MSADPATNDRTHIAAQAEHTRTSAERLARSANVMEDSADRRTELAADRTVLAAERTYAAWVRTGLASLASGVGAQELLNRLPGWFGMLAGSVLTLFSAFCFIAAIWRGLKTGAPPPRPDTPRLPAWLLLATNGFLVVVSLAALLGIWLGANG